MKKNAFRYDGLMLNLGKIDDSDVTYFNGHEVGSTGKMPPDYSGAYDVPRAYLIPPEIVQWGKKNTIAVRVYDAGGGGGLYGGPVELTNRGNPDLLTLSTEFREADMIFRGSPMLRSPSPSRVNSGRNTAEPLHLRLQLTSERSSCQSTRRWQ